MRQANPPCPLNSSAPCLECRWFYKEKLNCSIMVIATSLSKLSELMDDRIEPEEKTLPKTNAFCEGCDYYQILVARNDGSENSTIGFCSKYKESPNISLSGRASRLNICQREQGYQ